MLRCRSSLAGLPGCLTARLFCSVGLFCGLAGYREHIKICQALRGQQQEPRLWRGTDLWPSAHSGGSRVWRRCREELAVSAQLGPQPIFYREPHCWWVCGLCGATQCDLDAPISSEPSLGACCCCSEPGCEEGRALLTYPSQQAASRRQERHALSPGPALPLLQPSAEGRTDRAVVPRACRVGLWRSCVYVHVQAHPRRGRGRTNHTSQEGDGPTTSLSFPRSPCCWPATRTPLRPGWPAPCLLFGMPLPLKSVHACMSVCPPCLSTEACLSPKRVLAWKVAAECWCASPKAHH